MCKNSAANETVNGMPPAQGATNGISIAEGARGGISVAEDYRNYIPAAEEDSEWNGTPPVKEAVNKIAAGYSAK
jgi:hypothetical protein